VGAQRFVRLFPERIIFLVDILTPSEWPAYMRLLQEYAAVDGQLDASDAKMMAVTRLAPKAWTALRDKLLQRRLARIEGGLWIDDHQNSSLDIQRNGSARGRAGAAGRWGST
jgi:hypothetical protein